VDFTLTTLVGQQRLLADNACRATTLVGAQVVIFSDSLHLARIFFGYALLICCL
jgi:hypothetical protein